MNKTTVIVKIYEQCLNNKTIRSIFVLSNHSNENV
jgi:hypothetical protein